MHILVIFLIHQFARIRIHTLKFSGIYFTSFIQTEFLDTLCCLRNSTWQKLIVASGCFLFLAFATLFLHLSAFHDRQWTWLISFELLHMWYIKSSIRSFVSQFSSNCMPQHLSTLKILYQRCKLLLNHYMISCLFATFSYPLQKGLKLAATVNIQAR